ncbi:MAG: Hint domain-containing protein, partial [Pseudomonadota bacterium]
GCRQVTYVQLVFARHEIVLAEGAPSESFFPGPYAITACDRATRRELAEIFPSLAMGEPPAPARPLLRVGEARRMAKREQEALSEVV